MQKFRVLYFGSWGYGLAGLKGLFQADHVEIVKVFSKYDINSNDPYINQVYDLATSKNIKVFNTNRAFCTNAEFRSEVLSHTNIDFIVSCCYDRIFSKQILLLPGKGAVNVHPSILPKFRGVKPLENAIINGDEKTGVTIHLLADTVDSGDILLQYDNLSISTNDTFKHLYDSQCLMIESIMSHFFSNPTQQLNRSKSQNEALVSFAPRLNFEILDEDTVAIIRSKSIAHVNNLEGH